MAVIFLKLVNIRINVGKSDILSLYNKKSLTFFRNGI